MSEHKILVKLVGCSDVISPSEARRLSLDVISPDMLQSILSHMGNETGCLSGKNSGVAGCSDVISPKTGYPNVNNESWCGTKVIRM